MNEIRVPSLGESIVEATISKWLKQEGDTVSVGEPIVELETDKVNLEVASEHNGVLSSLLKAEGDTVAIGDVLAQVGDGQQPASSSQQQQPASSGQQQQPASSSQQQQPASSGQQQQPAGKRQQPASSSQQQASGNGQPHTAGATHTEQPLTDQQPQLRPAEATAEEEMMATPVALRVAADNNIDIRTISGSGPGGRVTKEDVVSYLEHQAPPKEQHAASSPPASSAPKSDAAPAPAKPAAQPARPAAVTTDTTPLGAVTAPAAGSERPEERIRLSRRRQTIAQRLVEAQRTAAMLTTFNEIDMSAVMDLRKRRKDQFKERHGINLGFMSFFTRAVVGALKAFPMLNAEIQGSEVVVKHYYDIGIAVGTEQGLVVPVLRNADRKTFAQIERDIAELANRARDNALTLNELQGGTFSITNGGIYGSLMSTPILNAPQVGILGMHKIEERPIVVNGEVAVRPMMYVALSYDHRIVDGSVSVRFLVRVKELMEDPEQLLLEG